MKRDPRTPDCSIADCTRAAASGFLCATHRAMVPVGMRRDLVSSVFLAQMQAAYEHRQRQLEYVSRLVELERAATS